MSKEIMKHILSEEFIRMQKLAGIINESLDDEYNYGNVRNWKPILKEGNETNENDFYLLKANENQLKMLKNISFNLSLDQEKYTDESNWITSKNFDVLTTDGLEMQNLKSYPIFRKREIRNRPTDYIYLTWNKEKNELIITSSHNGPENFYEFEGPFKGNESHRYQYYFSLPK